MVEATSIILSKKLFTEKKYSPFWLFIIVLHFCVIDVFFSLQLLSVQAVTYDFFGRRTIKLWALTGQPLLEMIGHTSLVYSVDAHSSGLIASGSEDRSVKIWKGDLFCMLWRILVKMQWHFFIGYYFFVL